MSKSIDYSKIADLYDAYVAVETDIPFFVEETARAEGSVLELMCGTGRVSIPLLRCGVDLTCVDDSPEMLARFREKLSAHGLPARIIRADVRDLSLEEDFSMAIIPFNSFSELTTEADQSAALASIYHALVPGGTFICTLHNPAFRLRTVDGTPQVLVRFTDRGGGGDAALIVESVFDPLSRIVSGTQTFEIRDGEGSLRERRVVDIRFSLPDSTSFRSTAAKAGFTVDRIYGDYSRAEYREETSPYMIWFLRK